MAKVRFDLLLAVGFFPDTNDKQLTFQSRMGSFDSKFTIYMIRTNDSRVRTWGTVTALTFNSFIFV